MKMVKFCLLVAFSSSPALAQEQINLKDGTTIYPVRTDGKRDWQANYYRVEKGEVVPIRPDGQRDWSANVYRAEGDHVVQVRPDGKRDWKASATQR